MVVTPELLMSFPILKTLPNQVLQRLAAKSRIEKYPRRGVIMKAGESQDAVCFLFEGRLQGVDFTIDGREVGLYFVEPGDFCGELSLFDSEPQVEFVIALAASMVVLVPVSTLQEIMINSPNAATIIGRKLTKRVRQLSFQRSLLGLPNIGQRVCCQLWMLAIHDVGTFEAAEQAEVIINNPPTHLEIAIMLNVSRETVTRVFQTLQGRGIVRRDGPSRLVVESPGTLKALADGSEVIQQ